MHDAHCECNKSGIVVSGIQQIDREWMSEWVGGRMVMGGLAVALLCSVDG